MNSNNSIKFPIKVSIATNAHKRSLLLQAELGGFEFPVDEELSKHKRQVQTETGILLSNAHRLVRCIIDIQVQSQDAVGTRNALELARSLDARSWDTSPLQIKQVQGIGVAGIRRLVMGGVTSIEALEATEPHQLEMLLSRNPPFGQKLLSQLKGFPKLMVTLKMTGKVNPLIHTRSSMLIF